MNYPLISEYVEAIRLAEENLEQLAHLRPVLDSDGNPVMSSGNFAVVFKMYSERDGKCYALKCFIKDQQGRNESYRLIADELEFVSSDFLVPIKFCDKELFVDTDACSETEFPVVVMDWVEGITLDRYVRQNLHDQYALQMLTYQFCRMASWLMSQPFAHGDLKPDNILVRDDGSLVLVDYDGMYVPAMQGQKARELGSPDYRHPARTEEDFNEHIDDFSLATIAMQLCAISLDPSLLPDGQGDTLLLTKSDYCGLVNSAMHKRFNNLLNNQEFERLYALFHLTHANTTLSGVSFRIINIEKPANQDIDENLSTKKTAEDIKNGYTDEYGATYSKDGLRLLDASCTGTYRIKNGTKIICDGAFAMKLFDYLIEVYIPSSVVIISKSAFDFCFWLKAIYIPYGKKTLFERQLSPNIVNKLVEIPNTEVTDEDLANGIEDEYGVIYSRDGKRLIKANKDVFKYLNAEERGSYFIKEGTTIICDNAFKGTINLDGIPYDEPFLSGIVVFPHSVIAIGNRAFEGCCIGEFRLSKNLLYIGDYAFADGLIKEFTIPHKVTHIGKNPFINCPCLITSESNRFIIKDNCLYTNDYKKIICYNHEYLKLNKLFDLDVSLSIVDGTEVIGENAFNDCDISEINIPSTISIIEKGAFAHSALNKIHIPEGIFVIDDYTFWYCRNLEVASLPNTIRNIRRKAFGKCSNLNQINIPESVLSIGERAFTECEKLKRLTIPKNVIHIGYAAFNGCDGCDINCLSPNYIIKDHALYNKDMSELISCFTEKLEFIIPEGVHIIGKHAFEHSFLQRIEIPNSVTTIDQYAMSCDGLKQITIPGSVRKIKDHAFSFSEIEEVVILEGVEIIGDMAFYYCKELKSIKLPHSLKRLGKNVFEECWNLETINIPIGTRSKFEELLKSEIGLTLSLKKKLKELNNQ